MIDYFAIGLTHCLLALAALRLMGRADLDDDNAEPRARTFGKARARGGPAAPGVGAAAADRDRADTGDA